MYKNIKLICKGLFAIILVACISSCKKDNPADLGALPKADFKAIPQTNPNEILFVNTSTPSAIPRWRMNELGQTIVGDSAIVGFDVAGTYNVTLFAMGRGGIDSVTKQIVIAQNDPTACLRNVKGFIAGCGSTGKTWKLNPEAGAYKVGDASPTAGNWWSSGAGDVGGRACEFNDEYKFTYSSGVFNYDNKGDFYGDGYLGNNSNDCQPNSNYTPTQAPWGSNNYTYSFTEKAGIAGKGQLKVIGLGAHIGLQKVRNGGEVTTPATEITYDVLEYSHEDGYDLLTVGVNIGGNGWWAFTLRSN